MDRVTRFRRGAAVVALSSVLSAMIATTAYSAMNVLGNRYDNNRSGANLTETTLSPATVSPATFGKLWSYPVDGAIFAQPLYVQGVTVSGQTTSKNVLYVATMHDVVYAFDADNPSAPLWSHDYRATGITPGTPFDTTTAGNGMGIIGTPVIDAPNFKMYFVAETMENSAYVQRLHVLDIRSGIDLAATVITATANGQTFSPEYHSQRPGLALSGGQVWIAFGSTIPGDFSPWHGWIMTYNATTLAQSGVFVTTTGNGGGIWQSGGAPAVDAAGNVYYLTGNGTGQAYDGVNNFQESLLKLAYNNGLSLVDWYTDATWATLDQYDLDLTVNGPMLVPGTSLLAFGGKVGISTVLNTAASLGHLTAGNAQVIQQIQTGPVQNPAGNDGDRIIGLTFWQRPTNSLLFAWPGFASLNSYTFNGTTFAPSQQLSNNLFGEPSAAVSVSANGGNAGTGIVWAAHNTAAGRTIGQAAVVEAYNADNLNSMIWSSNTNASRDALGSAGRFVIPVVDNGKMYMATSDGNVTVYGLLTALNVTNVTLSSVDNVYAITPNGSVPPSGGMAGSSYSYSSNLLSTSLTFGGETYLLGSPGMPSAVTSATIALPAGNFSALNFLAEANFGAQLNQNFVVTYTDGTSSTFTQSLSDWGSAGGYGGESIAATESYRVTPTGATQAGPWNIYGYSIPLNSTKTVKSVALPANQNVIVMAMNLVSTTTTAAKSFTLSAASSTLSVAQNASSTDTITVNPVAGFTGSVTLSVSGAPSGVSTTFSPSNSTTGTSGLVVTVAAAAAAGTYPLTITGVSGTVTATTTVSLVVPQSAPPSFTVAASPTSVTVKAPTCLFIFCSGGSAGSTSITVTPVNGFTAAVSFTVSGVPSWISTSFSPTTVTSKGSTKLTLTPTGSSGGAHSAGTPITVTATSGSTKIATNFTLVY